MNSDLIEAAHKIALSHSNYGHIEGNRRAFAIADDLKRKLPPTNLGHSDDDLRAERDDADRRAGAAERRCADLEDSAQKRRAWLRKAKRDAGFNENVSFDHVWEKALAALLSQSNEVHDAPEGER